MLRKIGYLLLAGGFLSLVAGLIFVPPMARAITMQHYKEVTGQDSFTREQMQQQIRDSVYETAGMIRWLWVPTLAMLAGGICVTRAKRAAQG